MYIVFILLLVFIIFYLNQNILTEKFNVYQTFQSFQSFKPFIPSQQVIPINGYKYPIFPLINPMYSSYWNSYFIPWSNGYTNLPWWNTSLGNTTNMSYDLRGDPLITPRTNFVWNNGTNFPIYNQGV